MTRYSVQPRYLFVFFAKNMGNNIGKNIRKSLNSKYGQKIIGHA